MIEAQNLGKSFKGLAVVQGVSLLAPDAQVTGLLGPNGAGKTTTLRMIYTLLKPDQGTALIDGLDVVTQVQAVQQRLGVLPDSRGLYPRLTARENVRYFGRLYGLQGAALEQNIDELGKLLDMQDFLDRPTTGFSQGQRLKVALARTLVHRPPNIILDEPTNGLDVMSTRALRTLVRRLRDEGKCILFSSHVMQEVAALCDRVVIIAQGKVVAQGTPETLRQQTGQATLEDAFVSAIGSAEGLLS
jgi:sodium transport system ATP-binding protein